MTAFEFLNLIRISFMVMQIAAIGLACALIVCTILFFAKEWRDK